MIVTPNLGLTVWNLNTDPYNHEELAENWIRIDAHAHTGGEDGKKIGTSAIEDASVTAAKLAPGTIPPLTIANGSIAEVHLQNDSVSTAKIQNGAVTENKLVPGLVVPIGSVVPFAGTTAPAGWTLCNGSLLSRTTYSDLFTVVGTSYGVGDGSTTFGVPDYRGRVGVGVNASNATIDARGKNEGQTNLALRSLVHTHAASALSVGSHSHTYGTLNHVHRVPHPIAVGSDGDIRVIRPNNNGWYDAFGSLGESDFSDTATGNFERGFLSTQTGSITLDRYTLETTYPEGHDTHIPPTNTGNTSNSTASVNGTTDSGAGGYLAINHIIRHGVV